MPIRNPQDVQVTQTDVARRAGVSRSIVSYVINGGPRSVAPETRDRVLKAIEELGYRPNKHAQMLPATKAGVTADGVRTLVVPDADMMVKHSFSSCDSTMLSLE